MAEEPPRSLPTWKKGVFQVISGGSAGFVEVCIMQPLDVIKTRIQLQGKSTRPEEQYSGMLDCVKKMYRYEGLASFWKGILPPILVETPKRAIKFTCFEQFKPLFMFGSPTPTPLTYVMSGLSAGLTESFIVTPFEVIKIMQQSDRRAGGAGLGTLEVTKRLYKEHGFSSRGLYKGLTATMARAAVFNTVYFGFYHTVKDFFPSYDDPTKNFLRVFSIGFLAGIFSSLANTPLDVVKSRIQGPQPEKDVVKYGALIQSLKTVYNEEGVLALYKGLVPKMMRLGPGGAILLIIFENVYEYLQKNFA